MIRLILRRDRALLPLWILFPAVVPVAFVAAFTKGFPTQALLDEYAQTSVHNTAFTVTYGALNGSSLGELVTWRAGFLPVMVGLITLLTVIRHTRTEEEAGRSELVGATPVSRHAELTAALVVTCTASLVLGALSALFLIGQGLGATGSFAYGAGVTAAGCVFAGVGAVVAQLTSGAGGARGVGIVVLGVAFLLRGMGDVAAPAVAWFSPFGWSSALRPFSGERWWVLLLPAAAVAALVWLAVALSERRDLGDGLFHERPGPATAAPGLRSPLALAWRLHRGALASRAAGFAVVGFGLGAIADSIGDLMNHSTPAARAALARIGGPGTVVDQYFVGMMTMFGVTAAGLAIHSALRLRAEENDGRAEPVLATPTDRATWAWSHLLFALLGPVVWLALFGAAAGFAHGQTLRVLGAALVQVPAAWLFVGLAFALFGLLPRLAAWSFAALFVSLFFGWIAGELQLSQWVLGLSAFSHVPQLPGGPMSATPLVVLTALAALLVAAGLYGLRRRDLPA
ncbi:ABC transporter permease [Nonomuraea sp. NPDC050556]|uniref:ABC transporter permease n=1 Tax=Nonomuraea sp. NPDC050556 TaxID=3364369 RepID=UPI0037AA0336